MNQETALLRPSREEIAQREIGQTEISRGTALCLIGVFVATLWLPAIAQLGSELLFTQIKPRQSLPLRQVPPSPASPRQEEDFQEESVPSSLRFLAALPKVTNAYRSTIGGQIQKLMAANRQLLQNIDDYERQLEERSLLTRNLLGPTRELLAKFGGVGSDRVEIGRDGWLFFRPDIDYLIGPGFLEPQFLTRRARAISQQATAIQPDPRQAILEFHQQLAERGIRLIVMPTPGKTSIYPERLSQYYASNSAKGALKGLQRQTDAPANVSDRTQPLQNPSFQRFQQELHSAGVFVFDPSPALFEAKRIAGAVDLYLRTDTHWSPAGVDVVASRLSEIINRELPLPQTPAAAYRQRPIDVTNLGDIAVMMRLAAGQTLIPCETVTVQQIEQGQEAIWQPDKKSDVLLLGDSFTNIYSLSELNWGLAAGLAEQLSFHLQRPIDCLAQNNGGAFAVRQTLFQELAQGHDRLAGKRVVIWQFSMRDLTSGDWKLLSMPTMFRDTAENPSTSLASVEQNVQGTVSATAGVPRPGSVPYRDAVTCVHLVGVKSSRNPATENELVVYLWGMRDNHLMPAAKFTPGQQVNLRLVPWETVKGRYERFNRIELDDPDFRLAQLPIYWGEEVQ